MSPRGGYTDEQWTRARMAVVEDGATYRAAADAHDIDLSTLQKRAAREEWQKQRRAHVERAGSYRSLVGELKHKLLRKALGSGDANDVHAWNTVERAFPERHYSDLEEGHKRQLVAVFITTQIEFLTDRAPSVLGVFSEELLQALAEKLLAADWNRR